MGITTLSMQPSLPPIMGGTIIDLKHRTTSILLTQLKMDTKGEEDNTTMVDILASEEEAEAIMEEEANIFVVFLEETTMDQLYATIVKIQAISTPTAEIDAMTRNGKPGTADLIRLAHFVTRLAAFHPSALWQGAQVTGMQTRAQHAI